jgi:ParB family chromosome partitioning protein
MMKNIDLSLISPSKTNPRGKDFSGPQFDDLVSSIKEKGVLMPILVRPISPAGKAADYYEIIAGHRRFSAAQAAGLKDIPAKIQDMTDTEAREAQIVENLQRQDINPIDEGEAYKSLIEKSRPHYQVSDVAIKVGKSESYVRGRLVLTNLSEKARAAFRKDLMTITHAILIARIDDEKIATLALNQVIDRGADVDDLKEFIQEKVYLSLSSKPWAKDAKLAEMVGDNSPKGPNLFDDPKAGIDPVAFAKQMAAFIEIKRREYEKKGINLMRVSTEWGSPDLKGVLATDQYTIVTRANKENFKTINDAIIVQGNEIGKIVKISQEKEAVKGTAAYKPTEKEKADRKAELAKEVADKEKKNAKILAGIAKVKMPLSEKHLDVFFDVAFRRFGFSYIQPVAARHGIKAVKVKKGGYEHRDLEGPVRKHFEALGKNGKLQFIFEVGLEAVGGYEHDHDAFLKKL